MTTLVIGARGGVGAAVLRGLLSAGEQVRASSRNPAEGEFSDGVEVVRADLTDADSLPPALSGVRKVFLYANPQGTSTFAAAATAAGVEQVVLLSSVSVLDRDAEANPIGALHLGAERALDAAGLPRTFVRPGYFATNALRWRSIRAERTLRTAYPDGTTTMVHEQDIADVAVRALIDDAHIGAAYPVLGAGPSTVREQVAAIAAALGEPVVLQEVDVDTYRQELLHQLPAPIVDRLLEAKGSVPLPAAEVATDSVPAVLHRPALTFARWAQDHVADFR